MKVRVPLLQTTTKPIGFACISTPRLTPLPAYNRGRSSSFLSSESYIPGHSNRAIVVLLGARIIYFPANYCNSSWTSCTYREGWGVGIKPRRLHRPGERSPVSVNQVWPIRVKLHEGLINISPLIIGYSPTSLDIKIIVDIKILQEVGYLLTVDGYILPIIGRDLNLNTCKGKLPKEGSKTVEPRARVNSYGTGNSRVYTTIIVSINGDKVISQLTNDIHVECSWDTLCLEVAGLLNRCSSQRHSRRDGALELPLVRTLRSPTLVRILSQFLRRSSFLWGHF